MSNRNSSLSLRFVLALSVVASLLVGPGIAWAAGVKDEAAALSKIASSKYKEGQLVRAAELYHEAFRMDPATLGYLFSAARLEHKAGDLPLAERDYTAFLEKAPKNDPLQADAAKYLHEVQDLRAAEMAKAKAAESAPVEPTKTKTTDVIVGSPDDVVPKGDEPVGGQRISGLVVAGTGALVGVSSLVLYLVAASDRSALQVKLSAYDRGEQILDIGHDEAQRQAASIATKQTVAAVGGGLGVAAVGVGVWLMLQPASRVAVGPAAGGHGVEFAVRF